MKRRVGVYIIKYSCTTRYVHIGTYSTYIVQHVEGVERGNIGIISFVGTVHNQQSRSRLGNMYTMQYQCTYRRQGETSNWPDSMKNQVMVT